jgi:predicted transcriptional regulator
VLRVLWVGGEAGASDVAVALGGSGRSLAYNTVLTTMARLHAKGLLTRRKVGKRHLYRPTADEAGTLRALGREAVEDLIARLGTTALAAFAERLDRLTTAERDALRRIADGLS